MFALGLVAICIVFGAVGQVLMKSGMSQVSEIDSFTKLIRTRTVFLIFTNVYVIAGLLLYVIAAFLWLGALSTLNVSSTYPLLSLGYVLAALLGVMLLKEQLSLLGWGGVIVVVVGCFMLLKA